MNFSIFFYSFFNSKYFHKKVYLDYSPFFFVIISNYFLILLSLISLYSITLIHTLLSCGRFEVAVDVPLNPLGTHETAPTNETIQIVAECREFWFKNKKVNLNSTCSICFYLFNSPLHVLSFLYVCLAKSVDQLNLFFNNQIYFLSLTLPDLSL